MKKWLKEYWQFVATGVSGLLILIGWALESQVSSGLTAVIFITAFIIGGFEQAREGIRATIETHKLNVELLMVLAATGASIIGYWLEGAVLIFIFALSGALENYATSKSKREISKLMAFQPDEAYRIEADGELRKVAVSELAVHDAVLVRPGESVPIDGIIRKGVTTVNEAAINGESLPAEKAVGEDVFGGTINISGAITIEVTKAAEDTLFSKIIQMVKEAQSEPSQTARFIEKFEDKYVKIVLLMVGVMLFLPHFALGWSWNETFYRAMVLLTVASPCALVAAVTPATLAAISNGARHGILFKGGVHLENLRHVRAIAFDKTGTLTKGEPVVTDFIVDPSFDRQTVIDIAVELERRSMHPLAKAVVAAFDSQVSRRLDDLVLKDVPGWGVATDYDGKNWKVGKKGFVGTSQAEIFAGADAERLASDGKTVVYISCEDEVVALLAMKDVARPEAQAAIAQLKRNGIQTIMVTGDNEATGLAIGREIGIDYVIAGCLPEQKVEVLKELKDAYGKVAMVGDGINDAPALANATVGIAMGEGTDIAMESADVVLMKNDLGKLSFTYQLSKRLNRITWQNIIFAIAVIICLITANLFQSINLPFAVIGHEGSTILVILNGLWLLYSSDRETHRETKQTATQSSGPKVYRLEEQKQFAK
ncbi:heavy metal translocating P-type ATPase [Listeria costaricensis]|uniref:heavy metal translocating P-type ATPase n=1 Tax=Listeria costaricensis TaxID=2026604 RepID=UPI000C08D349|nr:heavy metal translocating P-type ATPase [Listeria costaricensis]